MKRLLVIDDDAGARASLRTLFETDYVVALAANADEGFAVLQETAVDLVLLDLIMPQKDGLTILQELLALYPDMPVIMVSASDRVRPLVESMRHGAVDFVSKPFDVRELRALVQRTLEQQLVRRRSRALESEVASQFPAEGCIGNTAAFQAAVQSAQWAARSGVRVLIQGEGGTGKEMLARQIHLWSSRNREPFVIGRCVGGSEIQMDQRLFGQEDPDDPAEGLGKVDLAGTGTLYLQEVCALSPALQEKLAAFLHDGTHTRQGGSRIHHSQARVMAGSTVDVEAEVKRGAFREDLFHLLNVTSITLPPLRERREDIPLLIPHFLNQFHEREGTEPTQMDAEAEAAFINYDWPGNLRELRLVLERMALLHAEKPVLKRLDLPPEFQPRLRAKASAKPANSKTPSAGLSDSIQSVERELLVQALRENKGVQTKAAKQLGITRRILKYKMDKLNITLPLPEE